MKRIIGIAMMIGLWALSAPDSDACTGISLNAQDGSRVVARTVEWAATPMQCGYVVAPRGHEHQPYTVRIYHTEIKQINSDDRFDWLVDCHV